MITYDNTVKLMFVWLLVSFITGISLMMSGGDSAAADFINQSLTAEQIAIDQPSLGGSNPVSAALGFAGTSLSWVNFVVKAASLQAPWWEGWAQPIRALFVTVGAAYVIGLIWEGLKTLAQFVPGGG
jgi:hypothetical protein